MSQSLDAVYAQIKQFESSGQLTLPEPQDTVEVGSINALTGEFVFSVPTTVQTIVVPPLPGSGQRTNQITNITAGVVRTNAVDLLLKFNVAGRVQIPPVATERAETAARVSTAGELAATTGGEVALGPTVSIQGFPTIGSPAGEILLDAGMACSAPLSGPNITPPISTIPLTITAQGQSQFVHIMILRPPVLGAGAFTIPAVPETIVYAPPQGALLKNYAQYSDMNTLTRTLTTSVTSSTNTKTVQAYAAADLLGKLASVATAIAGLATGDPAAAAAGVGATAGAATTSGSGTTGGSKDTTSSDFKQASAELSLISNLVTAVGTITQNQNATTVTVESDQSLTLAISQTQAWGTPAELGPGVGDRFIYMSNVKVMWVAINGEVGIIVLGYESDAAYTAQELLADQAALSGGGAAANTGLDAATIKTLLGLDPFCIKIPVTVGVEVGRAPLVGPPRFVAATPPEQMGSGTSTMGDQVIASYEVTTEDKEVSTNIQTTITDVKPGWLDVIFGAADVETTTTSTLTMTQTTDIKQDEKITETIYLFTEPSGDSYDVMIFYDQLFGTMLVAEKGSLVLTGSGTGTLTNRETTGRAA